MKFGSQLKANRTQEWKFHFVDYDGLKKYLKTNSIDTPFTPEEEAHFEKLLLAELEKVASFQSLKLGEVQRRTEHCESGIQLHHQQQHLSSSSSKSLTPLASFVATESEIHRITQDLQNLARFQRLNYTAFLKILKKHDKHTTGFTSLRPRFMHHLNSQYPFHKENFAPAVGRLSSLYSIVRMGSEANGAMGVSLSSKGTRSIDSEEDANEELLLMGQQGYVPRKSAYWVHPDNVMDLKMFVLKYLPLVVYEPTSTSSASAFFSHGPTSSPSSTTSPLMMCESPVSTVYLDSPELDMYMTQVEQQDRIETVRLRWFGSDRQQVWVEHQQKTCTSTEQSADQGTTPKEVPVVDRPEPVVTKHRFQIKAKHVPRLFEGQVRTKKMAESLRRAGQKTEKEIESFEELTRIVQSRVEKRELRPVVQTFFNRTTFQVPGDARVRITLDTDLVMVREHPGHGQPPAEWYPTELSADDFPFSHIPERDIARFPYAVLQVRTLTEPQEKVPSWVEYVAESHLVESVPNFCKDLHAIATLYESRVGLLPFWLSEMDRDIRKTAVPAGFPRRMTSNFSFQDSTRSSVASSSSSLQSTTPPTSVSDAADSPVQVKASKKKLDKQLSPSPELLTVNRAAEASGGSSNNSTVKSSRPKKPVVSCLKKHGSFSSMRSTRDTPLASPTSASGSERGYGSSSSCNSQSSRTRKSVSFHTGGGPLPQSASDTTVVDMGEEQVEQTYFPSIQEVGQKTGTWRDFVPTMFRKNYPYQALENENAYYGSASSLSSQQQKQKNGPFFSKKRRAAWTRFFWTGLSVSNVGLLFIGLVVALMNLGDNVGMGAASLFLVVSCLCMGSTVWAHLIRMDGGDDSETQVEDEDEEEVYGASSFTYRSKARINAGERQALLQKKPSLSSGSHQEIQYSSAADHGRWMRTRVMPLATFVLLGTVVGLNVVVRVRSFGEDVGSGSD